MRKLTTTQKILLVVFYPIGIMYLLYLLFKKVLNKNATNFDDFNFSNEELQMQEFGMYEPSYNLANSLLYKERLTTIRNQQKEMIKNKQATTGKANWKVNGSSSQGAKMVADMQKLLLRTFNTECDDLVNRVTYLNLEKSKDRIYKSSESISKLGQIMNLSITKKYIDLKIEELLLAFEYAQKKQDEKEEQREIKAQMREEAALQKEIDATLAKIKKDEQHHKNAIEKINAQLLQNPEDETLLSKKAELEETLAEIEKSVNDINYRVANVRAGYVYIISNIGSFGENIYKIGMTRRLEPQDRIDELGNASVPFRFDVHAMIFSEDAPTLENILHTKLANNKVNMVNPRKEFFNVTIDEIENIVISNFDKTVEFTKTAVAEQYRQSVEIRKNLA